MATPRNSGSRNNGGGADELHYDNVKAFLQHWELDICNAVDFMRIGSRSKRDDIMGSFSLDGLGNANDSFRSIIQELVHGRAATIAPPEWQEPQEMPALEEFAQRWDLNEDAMRRLRQLPKSLQEETMASFSPPADTRDLNGKFISFMNSKKQKTQQNVGQIERQQPAQQHRQPTAYNRQPVCPTIRPLPLRDQANSLDFEGFAQRWSLNEDAIRRLSEAPFEIQQELMANFNPPEDTRNVSAKLISFLNAKRNHYEGSPQGGHHGGGQRGGQYQQNPLDVFSQTWGLNSDAVERLHGLPPETLNEVLVSFNPPADTRNVSAKLISFVKTKMAGGPRQHDINPLTQFVQMWGLNEDAATTLMSLPWEQQQHALNAFAPPPDTRDVNGKFISWVRKQAAGGGPPQKRVRIS